jgi:hypothetical protein
MALIYTLVRKMKPQHVVEIGTYNGGTSEAICHALRENGRSALHTVGPFDAMRVVPIFESWPDELRRHLRFYPTTSMEFYYELAKQRIRPEIAFVDGDHSYEAALFDIQSLAKLLSRGGFIIGTCRHSHLVRRRRYSGDRAQRMLGHLRGGAARTRCSRVDHGDEKRSGGSLDKIVGRHGHFLCDSEARDNRLGSVARPPSQSFRTEGGHCCASSQSAPELFEMRQVVPRALLGRSCVCRKAYVA